MVESIPNYDKWKLQESPSVCVEPAYEKPKPSKPHPMSLSDKVGQVVELWVKNPKGIGGYRYVCGTVMFADNRVVQLSAFGHEPIYLLDDISLM